MPGMKPDAGAQHRADQRRSPAAYDAATARRVRGEAPTAESVARSGRASESERNVAVSVPPSISTPTERAQHEQDDHRLVVGLVAALDVEGQRRRDRGQRLLDVLLLGLGDLDPVDEQPHGLGLDADALPRPPRTARPGTTSRAGSPRSARPARWRAPRSPAVAAGQCSRTTTVASSALTPWFDEDHGATRGERGLGSLRARPRRGRVTTRRQRAVGLGDGHAGPQRASRRTERHVPLTVDAERHVGPAPAVRPGDALRPA